jgi:hypothetical protein
MRFPEQLEKNFLGGILSVIVIVKHADALRIDASAVSMIDRCKVCPRFSTPADERPNPARLPEWRAAFRTARFFLIEADGLSQVIGGSMKVVGSALIGVSSLIAPLHGFERLTAVMGQWRELPAMHLDPPPRLNARSSLLTKKR